MFARFRPYCRWLALSVVGVLVGCQMFSDRLTRWTMVKENAVENPLEAVGGQGMVFSPKVDERPKTRNQLVSASPEELMDYYSPIFIQQRVDSSLQRFPYPPEYDQIGEAKLRMDDGKIKAFVAGDPKVYAIFQKRPIDGVEHVQITYTAWYPAHPRMKTIDLESADIDSIVLRITLDTKNAPLFYETIAACGCFHKVFVAKWLEQSAAAQFGIPEKDKKYSIERSVKDAIDWEVAGVVDEPREAPRRPVVFVKAGDHKVIGMGSASKLRVPRNADIRPYKVTSYGDLYALNVEGTKDTKPFFDLGKGGTVWGADRKGERVLFSIIGLDRAGQPRANDQIKLHFDQSTWDDTTIYSKFLRLPDRTLAKND